MAPSQHWLSSLLTLLVETQVQRVPACLHKGFHGGSGPEQRCPGHSVLPCPSPLSPSGRELTWLST